MCVGMSTDASSLGGHEKSLHLGDLSLREAPLTLSILDLESRGGLCI
jgi:hypothetical protein